MQAIAAMESKDFDSAIEAWNVILESDAKEFQTLKPEAKYEIACCLFEKEAYADAEKTLSELFEEYPEWDSMERAFNQMVRVLMAQKKLQEAQDLLADMHGKFPESVLLRSLYFQLGTLWYSEGKMPEAKQMFRRVLNETPKDPEDEGDFLHRNSELKLAWTIFNTEEYQETESFIRSLE
ncbi:MAG: tetratricopeptide repeat protein, partial [Thermoguttaceae bacterium]|nr:tetratricopeptide repeat protein [Thermoguttaceae bacterium]